jgi:hypothetical protein
MNDVENQVVQEEYETYSTQQYDSYYDDVYDEANQKYEPYPEREGQYYED